jgi:hypothetical protein
MIASFVGLVNLLGLLVLPQAAAVTGVAGAVGMGAVAAGPALVGPNANNGFAQDPLFFHQTKNADTDRHLVWSESGDAVCDAATMERVRLIYYENPPEKTSIVSCLTSEIQWDPDALLVISFVTATVAYQLSGSLDVKTTVLAEYTPTQGYCQLVDFCLSPDTWKVLDNQYAYDCSNVYCGEHAMRDCSGNYQSVACPQGTVVPEIPALGQVHCERALAEMSDTYRTACSPTSCQQFIPTTGSWQYTCQPSCVGCIPTSTSTNDDNSCFQATLSRLFGEEFEAVRHCYTDDEGNEACTTRWFGRGQINYSADQTAFLLYPNFGCFADYNGQACESCTPCGVTTGILEAGEGFNLAIDCSNIQADSRYNGCDQTATGLWDFMYEMGDSLSCPSPSSLTTPTTNGGTPETNNGLPTDDLSPTTPTTNGGTPETNNGLPTDDRPPSAGATLSFATATAALMVTTMGVFVEN